ncbi:NAD(P)-dependent oxidoreductase [Teichococcus globiformis]|uniref:NAD(P)-dependent oxidoreductase n=1 Tax=Teichococcus globiformis TaxID=2307229 RepID=UPI0036D316FE
MLATSALHPDAEALLKTSCELVLPADSSAENLRRSVGDADALIVRAKLPDDIFDHAPKLRACVRHGVGLDFIPVEAATRAGIPVANLPAANRQAVVEYIVAVAGLLARDLHRVAQAFRTEGWSSRTRFPGFELRGRTLGVVGCGGIGRAVAAAMQAAFGMRVLGHDPDFFDPSGIIQPVALDRLFAEADVITLHAPSTAQTRRIVDARRLAGIKPGAILINAARGDLIDDAALLDALDNGRLRAAALDVFEPEPLPADHPLHQHPALFLTPHIAGGSEESGRRMSVEAVEETLRILRGERPLTLVNPEIWDSYLRRHEGLAQQRTR